MVNFTKILQRGDIVIEHTSILIVDDERAIVDMLVTVLRKEGFHNIDTAFDANSALFACQQKTYGLILLDVMMPGKSGLDICPFIRQTTDAPIMFITARTSDLDMLTGFAVGADDYITKPFNPLVVVARIRAQLRRTTVITTIVQPSSINYDFGRFQLDEDRATLTVNGEIVHTPALVFQLLLFLCKHPNRVFSKSELYERVWGDHVLNDDNTVMVHIHRIRERIEHDPTNPQLLINVRGMGYKLVPPERDNHHAS